MAARGARDCQKLRYTYPRAALRHYPRQRVSPARMWGREVLQGVVNRSRIDGKDGVAVRFRRGAPHKNRRSGRVQQPTCRGVKSRQRRLPESLPVRLVRSEWGCAACRGHVRRPWCSSLTHEVVTAAAAGGRVLRVAARPIPYVRSRGTRGCHRNPGGLRGSGQRLRECL
jgi:hypothetical protein